MRKKLIVTLLSLTAALCCAFALAGCNLFGGDKKGEFTISNVKKIEMNYTQYQVRELLGEADETTQTQMIYYGSNYKSVIEEQEKIADQMLNVSSADELEELLEKEIKLENQLETMKYAYLTVNFNDNCVKSVIYDAARCESDTDRTKVCSGSKLSEESTLLYSDLTYIEYTVAVDFTDGSYKLIPLPSSAKDTVDNTVEGEQTMSWEDEWGTCTAKYSFLREYTYKINWDKISLSFKVADGDTPEEHYYILTVTGYGDFDRTNDVAIIINKYCDHIKEIIIGYGIDAPYVFHYFGAETITFQNDVTTIGSMLLLECSELKTINIPVSVTQIKSEAFANCPKLTDINYAGTITQWEAIDKHVDDAGHTGYTDNGSWNLNTSGFTVHCTDGNIEY